MRYYEIILEGVNQYLPMFAGYKPESLPKIKKFIADVEQKLKRKDRINWFLRWARISFVSTDREDAELLIQKYAKAIGLTDSLENIIDDANQVVKTLPTFEHLISMEQVPPIQSLVWNKQTPDELTRVLTDYENKYLEKLENKRVVRSKNSDDIILSFPNRWAWVDLNTEFSREEADAMGHCGNAGYDSGDTILSLRQQLTEEYWEPHLTFVLDSNGLLGEMKGRGNDKPVKRYHPYIIALLKDPRVRGLKGGKYLPENDFKIDDLGEAIATKLKKEKPMLRDAWEIYGEWETAKKNNTLTPEFQKIFEQKLYISLEPFGQEYKKIDWGNENIIIREYSYRDYLSFTYGLCHDVDSVITGLDLEDYLKPLCGDKKATEIANQVEQDYEIDLFEALLPWDADFNIYQVYFNYNRKTDIVSINLSIRDFLYLDDDEMASIQGQELDSTNDYSDYSDLLERISEDLDDVEVAIVEFCLAKNKTSVEERALAKVIVQHYEGSHSGSSRTSKDTNQLSFDLDNLAGHISR